MATKRQVFYSFHYKRDNWRVATIRNIGVIEGNRPASDNDWETVACGGKEAIKQWIKKQMNGRTCTVVLVGEKTAAREWIEYEIVESWNVGMGVVGIHIHGLKDQGGYTAPKGANPFENIILCSVDKKLSSVVKCYNPSGATSQERYDWISRNLSAAVEEAIKIRNDN